MFQLALRQCGGDASAAEDVVHDAWVRSSTRFGEFRGAAALRTWLNGFVIRVAWERVRSERLLVEGSERDERDPVAQIVDVQSLAADRLDLERAIAALPNGARQVLVLHDIEGYTHEEIAELLEIVVGTSKSQLARARAALRLKLREEEK